MDLKDRGRRNLKRLNAKKLMLRDHASDPYVAPALRSQLQLQVEPLDMCPKGNPTNKPCYFHPYALELLREAMKQIDIHPWVRSKVDGSKDIDVWCHGHDLARSMINIVEDLEDMPERDKWVHAT